MLTLKLGPGHAKDLVYGKELNALLNKIQKEIPHQEIHIQITVADKSGWKTLSIEAPAKPVTPPANG